MHRMLRPKVQTLPDSAVIGVEPTHVLTVEQPYYMKKPNQRSKPAGVLSAGEKVLLFSKTTGQMCIVKDAKGQSVYTACAGLQPIVNSALRT